jgi:hypothetical protein
MPGGAITDERPEAVRRLVGLTANEKPGSKAGLIASVY